MINIKNKLKRVKFYLFRTRVNMQSKIKKYNKYIAIVSGNKWKNKVTDDVSLKYYLNKKGIGADIISYEEDNDYSKYDALIIKSIWGFQKKKEVFDKWLKTIDEKNIKIFNSIDIILDNYDKEIQFNLMDRYNILHIDTVFIPNTELTIDNIKKIWNEKYLEYDNIVIKPKFSESGNDTYIISKNNMNGKNVVSINDIISKYKNISYDFMIQPYIEEINNGEYSLVCFSNEFSHAILRRVPVFNSKGSIEFISDDNLPKQLYDLVESVKKIDEYKDNLYMRIDVIKHKNKYLVMELELLDPQLFINSITNKKLRKKAYNKLSDEIIKRI